MVKLIAKKEGLGFSYVIEFFEGEKVKSWRLLETEYKNILKNIGNIETKNDIKNLLEC